MVAWTPLRDLLPPHRKMVDNVLTAFDDATWEDLEEGLIWYQLAHLFADKISGGRIEMGAGVIAAMSPQKKWLDNMYLAVRAFETGKATGQVGLCNDRAQRILDGENPHLVLGGRKVRAFYRLIFDPSDFLSVCIDRHAFDVVCGTVTDDRTRKILERRGGYSYIASVYRKAGEILTILPSAVQAVTWTHWRTQKGIV